MHRRVPCIATRRSASLPMIPAPHTYRTATRRARAACATNTGSGRTDDGPHRPRYTHPPAQGVGASGVSGIGAGEGAATLPAGPSVNINPGTARPFRAADLLT